MYQHCTWSLGRNFLLRHCCVVWRWVEEVGGQEAPERSAGGGLGPKPANIKKYDCRKNKNSANIQSAYCFSQEGCSGLCSNKLRLCEEKTKNYSSRNSKSTWLPQRRTVLSIVISLPCLEMYNFHIEPNITQSVLSVFTCHLNLVELCTIHWGDLAGFVKESLDSNYREKGIYGI